MALDEERTPYKPFQPRPIEPHYGRDRGFLIHHVRLALQLDERARTLKGTATITIEPLTGLDRIELDAEDLAVEAVRLDGAPARHDQERKKLILHPRRRFREGQRVQATIRYSAKPRRGMYFIQPDRHYPKKPFQIWTQGESEDNRCWFPAYDYPNNKATSETLLTVRKGLTAISNGHLVGVKPTGKGWQEWHWKHDVPHPNYLIAVVVGKFDEIRAHWDGIPLHYFVPRGMKDWGRETFKHTAQILEFFSRATGYRYPYSKYAQAIIADFMWGGMENTSMTTVNERFLIGPQHREDASPDGLIAHEAAHQWFGDLVTAKSWEHIWLNEGFATYFDTLFHEDFYGLDWFDQEHLESAELYFAEDSQSYRRPLVTREFHENEEIFDRHTYQKGSLVLHMLRKELGDDLWWKAIRHYVKKHEWKNVETTDLKIAIEEATGRSLDWFFDQWVFRAGFPELEASTSFDPKAKQLKLSLKQTQKVIGDTPLFRFDLDVWVWTTPERKTRHRIRLSKAEESYFFPAARKPSLVQLDPDGTILKKLKFDRDAGEWSFQLEHAPRAVARIEAARALARLASDALATPALRKALAKDRFWGVRMAAARALGDQETHEALEALLPAIRDVHPRVRRGVAEAFGNFVRDSTAIRALEGMARRDRSDYVVAAALSASAKAKAPRAFMLLRKNLRRKSHNDVIATSCLIGLAELKEARALPLLVASTAYGKPAYVRAAGTVALGKLWDFVDKKTQDEIRVTFQKLFRDSQHHQRRAVFRALTEVSDDDLQARVAEAAETEPIGLLRRVAHETVRHHIDRGARQAQMGDLKRQLEELRQENSKLKATVAEIEKKITKRR